MDDQKPRDTNTSLKWFIFLTLLACVAAWAIRGVLVRAHQMSAAGTSASTFASLPPDSSAKAVVRLESVKGADLKGILLEKQSDTVYLLPSDSMPVVAASLNSDTSVVMGKPEEIVVGAVVQLAGTVDANHILHATQVVILSNYVRVSEKAR